MTKTFSTRLFPTLVLAEDLADGFASAPRRELAGLRAPPQRPKDLVDTPQKVEDST